MDRFPDTFRTDTDRGLLGPKNPRKGIKTLTGWLTNSGCIAQVLRTPTHLPSMRHTIMKAMSEQLQSDVCVVAATEQPQHRPPLPKLDILAFDADEEPKVQWGGGGRCQGWGGPLDPHEVQTVRPKEIQYLRDREVYEYATETEARARAGRNPVGLKLIDFNKGRAEVYDTARIWCVRRCAIKGSNRSSQQHSPWKLHEFYTVLRVRKRFFRVEDPPLDFNCRCEQGPFLRC